MGDTTWPEVPLVELVEGGQISYGVVQPGREDSLGVPILRVRDVRDGLIDVDSPAYVSSDIAERHRRTLLRGGEVVVTLVGTVGEAAVVSTALAGWNVARALAVLRPSSIEAQWLQLAFSTRSVKQQIDAAVNTTVQTTLNLADLKRLRVPVPQPHVRQAIAEVLGALDDKIAANARAAKKADQLASLEFQAAVAGVPFSGHTFDEVADVRGGGTPSSKVAEYWGGSIAWASPTDITSLPGPYLFSTSRTITDAGLANCASSLYPVGSILMTSRATIGAFALAQIPVAVNQGFIVVVPRDESSRYWIFHEMRSRVDEFLTHANGATFLELSRGNFRRLPVRLPEQPVLEAFARVAGALHNRAAAAHLENHRLTATRDALLPALMSGQLRVRDGESVVADVL